MNRLTLFLFLYCVLTVRVLASNHIDHVVLINASEKQVPEFSSKEIRLLFLGYPVSKNNTLYVPLINHSSQQVYDMFLQKVMYMTESRYRRRLVSRVFQDGGEQPEHFDKQSELLSNLKSRPNTVTFVDLKKASQLDGVKIVQRLW